MRFSLFARPLSVACLTLSFGASLTPVACARTTQTAPAAEQAEKAETFPPQYTESERAAVMTYWNQPGRYVIGVRTVGKEGPIVARLMPEASVWLKDYNNTQRPGKMPPTQKRAVPVAEDDVSRKWEAWVMRKLAYDRWMAQTAADVSNTQLGFPATSDADAAKAPPVPGVIPEDLMAAVGNPPMMYAAVLPRRYTVTFEGEEPLVYNDNIALGNSRSPYYRFSQGVISMGVRLREWQKTDLDTLFAQMGLTPMETNVLKAVSVLEGGFDSINTYDTGFVSVGFIQFATLGGGAGSLGAVLKQEKTDTPGDFEKDFKRFGVNVDDTGTLVVVDPQSGAEMRGTDAIHKIIDDKRLIAVFQRAGKTAPFQIAQIRIAKRNYYPADDSVKITVNGRERMIKVSEVIKSEAGMATLFDRKVNTGNIRILGDVVSKFMAERRLTEVKQVVPYERLLIPMLRWRTDFLKSPELGQPA